ncbi:MAG: HK97 family phage prohead protease [Oscillospiraceae bacterium]|nr:HK97 family phage prohead protease [Oscillospiraceae bacterium]
MKAELRADGSLHISGYVNVPGRQSRPVLTPRGRVIEVIEQGAFARALERAGSLRMLLDHDERRALASTGDGSLKAREDAVGLYAESVITDPEVIEGARTGKLRGWSFDMRHVADDVETRADGLPIRHVKDFDISEISLVMNKIPAYSSTSIEVRADTEQDDDATVEIRATDLEAEFVDQTPPPADPEEPEELDNDPEDPADPEDPDDDPDDDAAERLRTYEARLRALEL